MENNLKTVSIYDSLHYFFTRVFCSTNHKDIGILYLIFGLFSCIFMFTLSKRVLTSTGQIVKSKFFPVCDAPEDWQFNLQDLVLSSCSLNSYLLLLGVITFILILSLSGIFYYFLTYRGSILKWLSISYAETVCSIKQLPGYISSFRDRLIIILISITDLIKSFHTVFSGLAILVLYFLGLGSFKVFSLLIINELKLNLLKHSYFRKKHEAIRSDTDIVANHWKNDLDLIWLNRFLYGFRLSCYILIIVSLNNYLLLILPVGLVANTSTYFNLLIFSYIIELLIDLQVIFFRNPRVGNFFYATGAALSKGVTNLAKAIFGDEAAAVAAEAGTKVAENPGKVGVGIAGALGAAAGGAYEKSKHPIVVDIAKQGMADDDSVILKAKQYLFDGVVHTSSNDNVTFKLFKEHFKDVISIGELSENGLLSPGRIRERFDSDPNFAKVFYDNPQCFQPFGLGDKLNPELAVDSNTRNILTHGEANAKLRGLIIESVPTENDFTRLGLKVPSKTLKVSLKNLPEFNPNDPTANLPAAVHSSLWFKPTLELDQATRERFEQENRDKFWKKKDEKNTE